MKHIIMGNKKLWLAIMPALILIIASCGNKKKDAAGMAGMRMKQTVTAYTVQPAKYIISQNFPATLTANTIVQIRPDVSGYLEAVHAKDGSWVSQGQILYDIDKSRFQAVYNQAQATLQQAQATLAQNRQDLDRYLNLQKHDAVAVQIVDQAGTTVKVAEANVAADKAALNNAATNLNHSAVRASISGKIGIAQVKLGDMINAGQTLINTIVNDNPMYVDFNVPQNDIDEFTNKSKESGLTYLLRMPDGTTYADKGKLLMINNMVDANSGTITIRLEFPNPNHLLQSGMNAAVVIRHETADSALAVPTNAFIQTLNETSVYTIGKDNVIQSTPIVPGDVVDSLTVINSGLQPGENIVINGIVNLRPGDTVNVKMKNE
ncbi:MAG: efflux RND transporter periplasmic adaptor subunit [Chitinophagaceae bacterium]